MVGGLIMAHGDDRGLRVPPALAATQAVVLLVKDDDGAGDAAARLTSELRAAGVRVELDARVATSSRPSRHRLGDQGARASESVLVISRRGRSRWCVATPDEKQLWRWGAGDRRPALLAEVQQGLFGQTVALRDSTADVTSIDDAPELPRSPAARLRGRWSAPRRGPPRAVRRLRPVPPAGRRLGAVSEDEPDLVAIVGRSYTSA
jgi:prolyl-tRNA synthetase